MKLFKELWDLGVGSEKICAAKLLTRRNLQSEGPLEIHVLLFGMFAGFNRGVIGVSVWTCKHPQLRASDFFPTIPDA